MTITRSFHETVQARVARDPAFNRSLLQEAVQSFISGDVVTGKAILRFGFRGAPTTSLDRGGK